MIDTIRDSIWRQFGASMEMLEGAIRLCPAELWDTEKKFWYIAYHTLFYLNYYLTPDPENFQPPHPFTLSEFDPNGAMPDRTYTQRELLDYLKFCRFNFSDLMLNFTEERANARWVDKYKNFSILEILLYNMRHVQHHAAQLNLILRQEIDNAPDWISKMDPY